VDNEDRNNFVNLNRGNRWPDFKWQRLELLPDGALQLHSLPLFEGTLPDALAQAGEPEGPAGIAVDADGTIFFSYPAGDRVIRVNACDASSAPVDCIGGEGDAPTRFRQPRGLVIPAHRRSLFVADSGNNRVQAFDIESSQLVAVLDEAIPGAPDGKLKGPTALASDNDGTLYVVDYGNRRVVKFNSVGEPVPGFWDTIKDANLLRKPADVAVFSPKNERTLVFVLDEELRAVFEFEESGVPIRTIGFGAEQLQKPMGIAVNRNAIFVGDNARRRVLAFSRSADPQFISEAIDYHGPVAALAIDNKGSLLVHTGVAVAAEPICSFDSVVTPQVPLEPVRLAVGKGFAGQGVLWNEHPIEIRDFEVRWHRLKAEITRLGADARLRLFIHTSDDPADAPVVEPQKPDPFEDVKWQPRSGAIDEFANVDDLFIGGATRFLWIGALFTGDGRSTAVVSQMRVEFDQQTYLNHLPAIYRGQTPCSDFLLRFLSLFESFFGEVEFDIELLSELFDPWAAPREYLPWLAGWLALPVDEDWTEDEQRMAIAQAFARYGRRGTVEGLRESLRIEAGVEALIEEPIQTAAWWSLPGVATGCGCGRSNNTSSEDQFEKPETSILGVSTMLLPVQADGAVLGSTATLDGSNLITGDEFGTPLFEDTAHQFTVQVYRGQLRCEDDISEVRAVIEREKPAHTSYHLCVIEPRFRVGFQSRVGIDTVVGGPPEAMALSEQAILGEGTALGGEPGGQIGFDSRVGITTRVG
jgi:phage tail-like protein